MDLLHWFIPWEESPTLVVLISAVAFLYSRGCARNKPEFRRKAAFWIGLASIYLASHTQLDYYAEHQFFIHRLQHVVLHHLGPFLIVLSRPLPLLASGMPEKWGEIFAAAGRWRPAALAARVLWNPFVAVALFAGLIAFWLLPPIHFIAMIDWRLYRFMNWSVIASGLLFWGLVLNRHSLFSINLSPWARIAMMLAVVPPQIVLGAIIFFSSRELYTVYTICGRAIGGLSAIGDQQIGGIILWIHGAMMSMAGILIVVRRELVSEKLLATRLPG
ncbi:MAG TPA: cytochrome c oxidase assembly protein [Nitrosospira sp.]|nr:cytochrome c oxidase assembly protein [Nitrosospira sp.]